jgi:NAD(P)-dependent dehydrogenase (short-subunit alcohol dehydrogenase family)
LPAHARGETPVSAAAGIAVITGTTHGIGWFTSLELARAGRTVVMLCRDVAAGHRVRAQIVAQVPGASVHVVRCDLASLTTVRESAASLRREFGRIDLLINNAGTVSTTRRMSADGFELTFATNHLGPFLLTALLLDRLSGGARIVNVASKVHYRGRLELTRVTDPRARYNSMAAYAQSKLANVLHTFALARRLDAASISANCLHPGVVATHLLPWWLRLIKPLISRPIFDCERGARTSLYVALSKDVSGQTGCYFNEHQQAQPAAPLAQDARLQDQLWEQSARWVGIAA